MKLAPLRTKGKDGFTIVELLIVIVIIGILAALIIVIYGGIQQRANNSQTLSVLNDYVKATRAYAADNNKYPEPSAGAIVFSCVGVGYPAGKCLNVSAGAPTSCGGFGAVAEGPTWYNDAVKPYLGDKSPTPSLQVIPCVGVSVTGAAFLSNFPTGAARIYYVLSGTNCGAPGGLTGIRTGGDANSSTCIIILPNL